PGASPERLEALLGEEIAAYPAVRAAVDARGDRGAARALVWGEKADRMLSILLEQYREQGESMLEGTGVWLCTACGFVYVGDTPPEQCPVCRVPAWKFEKVEG
ncbi:MAG: rubredoxin, partial [Oscillospiraceae bacterium]|nr:rubredoxin [Oscillospiraceae bacterium]